MDAIEIDLVDIPGATALIGSSADEVVAAAATWSGRLVEASFTPAAFAGWLDKERPVHCVHLAAYRIGRLPVTNADYRRFLSTRDDPAPRSIQRGEPDDHPVWDPDIAVANRYLAWLREETGVPYRLATEAEWEHAARGPERLEFPWGDEFDPACANTVEAGRGTTTPVSAHAHAASPFGVVDLAGNVEEWTATSYAPYPGGRFVHDDLVEALGDAYPIIRGGSCRRGGDLARGARRHGPYPGPAYETIGFRVVCSVG